MKILQKKVEKGNGYFMIMLKECELYCCYISPNKSNRDYKGYVDKLIEEVRIRGKQAMIAVNINAKS